MDTIVLAGGFATRLAPTTNEIPKPLLPIAGVPILSYLMGELETFYSSGSGRCYLTTNRRFQPDFENFLEQNEYGFPVEMVVEDADSEKTKLGTSAALSRALKDIIGTPDDGVLVVAGDSVSSLDMRELALHFRDYPDRSVVALFDIEDRERLPLYGCAELEKAGGGKGRRIVRFEEHPEDTCRDWLVNTTYFILGPRDVARINRDYVPGGRGHIDWLVTEAGSEVNGFVFEGFWFDVGTHQSLEKANRVLRGIRG